MADDLIQPQVSLGAHPLGYSDPLAPENVFADGGPSYTVPNLSPHNVYLVPPDAGQGAFNSAQLRALLRIMATHGKAMFPREGPEFYTRAFHHNVPFAQGAPYRTMLSPIEEAQFRKWLASTGNPGNFNPDAWVADYDMRGYWKEQVMGGGSNLIRMNPNDKRLHGPDIYKTPYDTTFSGESKYAVPGTPFHWWPHDNLIDYRTGQLVIGPGQ